jgi:hypothetical protein
MTLRMPVVIVMKRARTRPSPVTPYNNETRGKAARFIVIARVEKVGG